MVLPERQSLGGLPAGWKLLPIAEAMSAIIDYRGKSPTKASVGIPLVTAKIVKQGRILRPTEYIAPEDYDAWMRRGLPRAGDVVMTTEAPLGEVAQLDGSKVALAQRLITLRGRNDILHNTFLKFLMLSQYVQSQLRARATGTTVTGIRQSELRKVNLPLPPLPEQKAIASILGALDDKIELNRRMNETLEATARAIFKSWFVDFDPVRAKAEGRRPAGMDAATAALLPDSFEDSPLGEIPAGWQIATLDAFARVTSGKRPGRRYDTRCDRASVPLYGGAGPMAYVEESLYETPILITGRVGTLGMVFRVDSPCWPSDNTLVIVPSRRENLEYVYHVLSREDLAGLNRGSTQPLLTQTDLRHITFVHPGDTMVRRFHALVEPLYVKLGHNKRESRTLAAIRDALLPKLLSGELRVKDTRSSTGRAAR